MDNLDNILNQLRDSTGKLKDNLHIVEKIVPMEEQMEYFEYSKHVNQSNEYIDRNKLIALLFTSDIPIEEKRHYLSVLAALGDIAAYRAIETYYSSPLEPELANWSALALIESRVLLDSELSGKEQILISTGLGGYNNMLRYFVIVASKDKQKLSELQQNILSKELKFQLERNKITIEKFIFKENYLQLLLLCDLRIDLKNLLIEVIKECNQIGDFVDERFLLTNMKQFTENEIEKMLGKVDDI